LRYLQRPHSHQYSHEKTATQPPNKGRQANNTRQRQTTPNNAKQRQTSPSNTTTPNTNVVNNSIVVNTYPAAANTKGMKQL
jgi:hypothetical protein